MKKIYILSVLCMLSSISFAQSNLKEILKNFNKPAKENVMVVSHRGDWRNAPENSIQAFQNCIDMGVDMVELDLKKTKDGVLVLMHDKKIDRTMNGKGFPENYTLDSLKMLRLKNGVGCKTRHQIPTFREVMELCKGKIMVNVDKGYDYFDDAMNLFTITDYSGYNPEVNARPSQNLTPGEDYGTYPLARTYMFGLNITL